MAGRQNGKVGSYNASMRPGIKPLTLVKNTRKHVTARRDPEILQVGFFSVLFSFILSECEICDCNSQTIITYIYSDCHNITSMKGAWTSTTN
jgi:hypothetical protein